MKLKNFIFFYIILVLSTAALETHSQDDSKEKKFEFINQLKTDIQNPFELRDPFKRKIIRRKTRQKRYGSLDKEDVFSNLPSLRGVSIDEIRIIGVLIGSERRAIAKIYQNNKLSDDSYVLKEGMKLGENDAEIKAILPGGIVLVEKIKNVYEQEEYLETVLPLFGE